MTPPGTAMVPLSFKVDADLLRWVDQDIARQHTANRSVWITNLLVALRDGHVQVVHHPVKAAVR